MDPYNFYITPAEYESAEANGVDSENLDRRVRLLGWNKEIAITTPLLEKKDRQKWVGIAEKNGIKYQTFMNRVNNLGWTEEKAATTPTMSNSEIAKRTNTKRAKNRKIPTDIVRLAESNGISYHTLRARIQKQKLDPYVAATLPVRSMKEVQKMGKEAYEKIHGRFNAKVFKS